jgi:uncharacterized protein YybS (DUF2232 family)
LVEPGSDAPTPPPVRPFGPGVAGVLSLAAYLSLPLVWPIGAFIALLAPLPLLHLRASGRTAALAWGWVSVALLGAALVWQTPWLVALAVGYLVLAAWPAIAIEEWLRHPWSDGRWVAIVTLVALAIFSAYLYFSFYPQAPADAIAASLASARQGAAEMLRLLGGTGKGGEELLSSVIEIVAFLAPSAGALYVLTSALWLRPRLPMLGFARGAEPFALFSSEEWLPIGFALGGLGWVFATGTLKWLSTNLFVTVLGLYFVHGLAIIHFYLGRRFGSNRWVRLIVLFFALQMPVAVVFSILGLVDSFFRLRRGGALAGGSET